MLRASLCGSTVDPVELPDSQHVVELGELHRRQLTDALTEEKLVGNAV